MKQYLLIGCILMVAEVSSGQFQQAVSPVFVVKGTPSAAEYLKGINSTSSSVRWSSDGQTYSRYSSPWLTQWPGTTPGQAYWLGSTTTQSFNKGKFGTIYYYDMLGNMRYARTFIDIAGKNKRGLKLLLPTINQRMFNQH